MNFINAEINNYINLNLNERPLYLEEMEEYARLNNFPIIGPQVGMLIYQLNKLKQAKNILELGSGYGYSAAWFALACSKSRIICTDSDKKNIELAKKYLANKSIWPQITFHCGDSIEIASTFEETFDIIFCDIDKWEYPDAFELIKEKSHSGSVIIVDNMLWSSKVLDATRDRDTVGIQEFTRLICTDNDFSSLIYPIRDGVLVALRK